MSETRIKELTEQLEQARNLVDALTTQLEAEKRKVNASQPSIADRFTPEFGEMFFRVESSEVSPAVWTSTVEDKFCFDTYNTWRTLSKAQEVAKKTRLLHLIEQVHDIVCPEYIPNWNETNTKKYYIYYDSDENYWDYNYAYIDHATFTYFDTVEHAKQACKILNDINARP